MARQRRQADDSDQTFSGENQGEEHKPEIARDDACRCEEASKKSVSELLKMMLADLAFWKKKKKSM